MIRAVVEAGSERQQNVEVAMRSPPSELHSIEMLLIQ